MDPPPLDGPRSEAELRAMAGHTITDAGIGGLEALRVFGDVLAPACISVDHPAYLSFVPVAPTEAAILFDLVVGASSIYGGSWLEGAGAVFAENEALRWLADLAGLPPATGGVFVAGGSAGNLSGLVAARHVWRSASPDRARRRAAIVASRSAHSSIVSAARVMDADIIGVPVDARARLTGDAVRTVLDGLAPEDAERVVAVVATAGTTNAGIVDDLEGDGDDRPPAGVLVPRRWRLRRRRPGRPLGPLLVRRGRAGRQPGDRPAQVVVRPVRLRGVALPAPRGGAGGVHPARRVPRHAHRAPGVEPVRLRLPPHAPRSRAAVLVLARDARHAGLRPGRRGHVAAGPRRRRADPGDAPRRAGARARALGRAVPPHRLGSRRATSDGARRRWPTDSPSRCRRRGTARPSCASAS